MRNKRKISDIFAYIQGNIRYQIFYSPFGWLMSKHIFEQIVWRINVMDIECFEQGSCKICGCNTTALQMANKACPKPCYPKMMNRKEWGIFKEKLDKEKKMEKFWSSKEINIGNIRVHKSILIKFQATIDIPEIIDLIPDCGCTKVKYDGSKKVLSVTYSAGNIPNQIPGNQIINKRIAVVYADKTTDVLYIKGTKIR